MVLSGISRAFIPKNNSLAYAPFMTKSGSTTLVDALKRSTDNAPTISSEDMTEEELDGYTFFSVLRHPLERALAGIYQVEVSWLMDWIGGPISKFNLTWWDKTCLNSTWGGDRDATRKYPCTGSHRQTTTERRLRRLNDFLDEVEEKGYWDQHIAPMTYLIATNKFRDRSSYFDIAYVGNLTNIMAQSARKEVKTAKHSMMRGDESNGQDWAFRWKELVALVPHHNLAKSAVTKLCHLYQHDVECLPYDIPECRSFG